MRFLNFCLRLKTVVMIVVLLGLAGSAQAAVQEYAIKPFTGNDLRAFIETFSEMRGPLRTEILKDRKTDFKDADPLKYIVKLQENKDVGEMLKKHEMNWDSFMQLTGNVLLAYYTIQPEMTKAAIVKRLADYGLTLAGDQIPPEYRPIIQDFVKTDAGAALAGMALDMVVQVPTENIEMVRKKKITLDKMFYTKYWRDLI